MNVYKIAGWVANSVVPDQTTRSAASDLRLRSLLRSLFPNMKRKFGTFRNTLRKNAGSAPVTELPHPLKVYPFHLNKMSWSL